MSKGTVFETSLKRESLLNNLVGDGFIKCVRKFWLIPDVKKKEKQNPKHTTMGIFRNLINNVFLSLQI
jgi:hypothetical protein